MGGNLLVETEKLFGPYWFFPQIIQTISDSDSRKRSDSIQTVLNLNTDLFVHPYRRCTAPCGAEQLFPLASSLPEQKLRCSVSPCLAPFRRVESTIRKSNLTGKSRQVSLWQHTCVVVAD